MDKIISKVQHSPQECLEAVVLGGEEVACSDEVVVCQPLLGALSHWRTSALTHGNFKKWHRKTVNVFPDEGTYSPLFTIVIEMHISHRKIIFGSGQLFSDFPLRFSCRVEGVLPSVQKKQNGGVELKGETSSQHDVLSISWTAGS
jgi:hypothetical protein